MWIFILIVIGVFLIYKFGKNTGEAVGSVRAEGGMRLKYSKLLNHILEGHKDCRIIILELAFPIMAELQCSIYNSVPIILL